MGGQGTSAHYMLLLIGGHRRDSKRFAFVKLDPADYQWAKQFRWIIHSGRTTVYAKRAIYTPGDCNTRIRMHRELLGLSSDDPHQVDHINGNGLDNRRRNLRVVTMAQNGQNRPRQYRRAGKSSHHRGVSWHRQARRWEAYAHLNRRKIRLGFFDDEETAATAAAAWRSKHMPYSADAENTAGALGFSGVDTVSYRVLG